MNSECCVVSDNNNLFSQQIHILDKYYDKKLLGFFSLAFGVRCGPDSEDYCKLWSAWERSVHELDISDCSAFWTFMRQIGAKTRRNYFLVVSRSQYVLMERSLYQRRKMCSFLMIYWLQIYSRSFLSSHFSSGTLSPTYLPCPEQGLIASTTASVFKEYLNQL